MSAGLEQTHKPSLLICQRFHSGAELSDPAGCPSGGGGGSTLCCAKEAKNFELLKFAKVPFLLPFHCFKTLVRILGVATFASSIARRLPGGGVATSALLPDGVRLQP